MSILDYILTKATNSFCYSYFYFIGDFITHIAPTEGHLNVQVHDEAYARVHVGVLGFNYDFFVARVCFKGSTEYNINILQVTI